MSPAELLTDDAFVDHQLTPTPASTAYWAGRLSRFPEEKPAYDEAKALLEAIRLGLDRYAQTTIPEETIRQLLRKIQQVNTLHGSKGRKPVVRRWFSGAAAVAAGLALLLGGGVAWWQLSRPVPAYVRNTASLKDTSVERTNTTGKPETFRLPDGSEVVLSSGSRLSYPADFNRQTRTVYLSGEASFSVTRNAGVPFLVYANDVVTKVIGTRFVVRAFEGEQEVRVNVQSGRVSVYQDRQAPRADAKGGVLLLPNQQVVFSRLTEQFTKSLIALPHLLPGVSTPRFSYEETPITQVFRDIEKAYGITILYNEETLGHCQLNASLASLGFEEKMGVICTTLGARYEIIDGQVILTGGGCE